MEDAGVLEVGDRQQVLPSPSISSFNHEPLKPSYKLQKRCAVSHESLLVSPFWAPSKDLKKDDARLHLYGFLRLILILSLTRFSYKSKGFQKFDVNSFFKPDFEYIRTIIMKSTFILFGLLTSIITTVTTAPTEPAAKYEIPMYGHDLSPCPSVDSDSLRKPQNR